MRERLDRVLAAVVVLMVGCMDGLCRAEDWPTFRGIDRSGISPEKDLLKRWEASGPKLLWEAKGAGRGYSSAAIADGRVYTLGDGNSTAKDKDEYLTCYDDKNGRQIWMAKAGPAWTSGQSSWQSSRSTPTVDGDLVYVITPAGKLICCKTADGAIAWSKDLKSDFAGKKKDGWGYSESPLIDGDQVVCTPGGPESTVVALNKNTGELIWKTARPDDVGAGHSSIVISQVGGKRVYVQNTGGGPIGIDAETGKLLWEYDMRPPTAFIPSPIIQGDLVFTVAGYRLGGALLQQVPAADGSVEIREIYPAKVELGNKHGGVVLVDGNVYGGREDSNTVYCAELMTGKILWEKRGSGSNSTSVIAADGHLYLRFANGTVAIAKIDPAGYSEISSFKTPGSGDRPSWAHPTIANGKLYLREGDSILCYKISK